MIFGMFLTYLPPPPKKKEGVTTRMRLWASQLIADNHKLGGRDERMFLRGHSLYKHLNPHHPLTPLLSHTQKKIITK